MLVPVSPSGTGKTLRASISSRASASASVATSTKRSTTSSVIVPPVGAFIAFLRSGSRASPTVVHAAEGTG
jgi:hypothetical protein